MLIASILNGWIHDDSARHDSSTSCRIIFTALSPPERHVCHLAHPTRLHTSIETKYLLHCKISNIDISLLMMCRIGIDLNSSLLSKNLKVRIYKTVILPVVLYGCETWTLTLREKERLRVFENKILRKIFGAKRDEVTGEWRKLHNVELHVLHSSPDIIRNIKSRRLRCAGHVALEEKNSLRRRGSNPGPWFYVPSALTIELHRIQSTAPDRNIEGGGFCPVLWIEFGVAQWSERLVRRTKDPGQQISATYLNMTTDFSHIPEHDNRFQPRTRTGQQISATCMNRTTDFSHVHEQDNRFQPHILTGQQISTTYLNRTTDFSHVPEQDNRFQP
ncbi:hypothetical protein ANN_05742 [Periplaneta americana]|uniref:Uncharacterized protein n=1 Tax=Periplaneta americana TaxID=6978 RepID=A0ABQ8TBM4_PERAM|nr:hypothetical protein ANN_05742 [Periplaneta americana]